MAEGEGKGLSSCAEVKTKGFIKTKSSGRRERVEGEGGGEGLSSCAEEEGGGKGGSMGLALS